MSSIPHKTENGNEIFDSSTKFLKEFQVGKLLFHGFQQQKTSLMHCIKDARNTITPWYHLASRTSSRKRPYRVPTHPCAVTCAHVVTYAFRGRPRNSETMFGRPFRTSFHHPRLSVTYLPAYSSLHRLCGIHFCYLSRSLHAISFFVNGKNRP